MYFGNAWKEFFRNLLWLGGTAVALASGLGFLAGWLLT